MFDTIMITEREKIQSLSKVPLSICFGEWASSRTIEREIERERESVNGRKREEDFIRVHEAMSSTRI